MMRPDRKRDVLLRSNKIGQRDCYQSASESLQKLTVADEAAVTRTVVLVMFRHIEIVN